MKCGIYINETARKRHKKTKVYEKEHKKKCITSTTNLIVIKCIL